MIKLSLNIYYWTEQVSTREKQGSNGESVMLFTQSWDHTAQGDQGFVDVGTFL